MADTKISELTAMNDIAPGDLLPIVDVSATATEKITVNQLFQLLSGENIGDGAYLGVTITGKVFGENVTTFGQLVCLKSDGKWWKADADGAGLWPARGIAVNTGNADAAAIVLVLGIVMESDWAWTVGATLYLSDAPATTCGITETAPTGTGDCIQVVGFALSDDEAFFNFTGNYAEHS